MDMESQVVRATAFNDRIQQALPLLIQEGVGGGRLELGGNGSAGLRDLEITNIPVFVGAYGIRPCPNATYRCGTRANAVRPSKINGILAKTTSLNAPGIPP